jgi:type II secretory pathway component GspD/PulD (secretin)
MKATIRSSYPRASRIWLVTLAFAALAGALLAWSAPEARAQAQSFSTIREMKVTPLSNGVQITVLSDGILQTRDADTSGNRMAVSFPSARNGTGKNFFNINRYPVSHITLSTPQGATGGIGVRMEVQNFVATNASFAATPDGQGILLTIQSDRTVASRAGASTSEAAATNGTVDTSTQVKFAGGLLSMRAVKADIHSLVGALAQEAGLSIAVDDAVDRKISLNLNDVAPEAALRSLATAYGLALGNVSGIWQISEGQPSDLATYRLSNTESFRLQNTQAGTASGLLPNFLYSYVKTNAEQNAVVVTAPTQVLAKIGADLARVDTPSPLIAIEAIAVEFTDSSDKELGLTFGSPNRNSFSSVDVGGGVINYSTVGTLPRAFEVNLRALEASGRARVRARPNLAVVNGRTANIFIGAQRFIQTQFNQFGQTQTRIQPVDVGVKLLVTPLTGGNNEITTRIAPEVSNITELDLQTGLPVLSTRRADTTVRVRSGETIAIGGLSLDQEQNIRRRIPGLGDLPLIGRLFRSSTRNTVRTELIVFVTPRILNASALGAPVGTEAVPGTGALAAPALGGAPVTSSPLPNAGP